MNQWTQVWKPYKGGKKTCLEGLHDCTVITPVLINGSQVAYKAVSEILVAWLLKDLPYIPYNLNTVKKKKSWS